MSEKSPKKSQNFEEYANLGQKIIKIFKGKDLGVQHYYQKITYVAKGTQLNSYTARING